jgi:hypothetical protein
MITGTRQLHSEIERTLASIPDKNVSLPSFIDLVSIARRHAKQAVASQSAAQASREIPESSIQDDGAVKPKMSSQNTKNLLDSWEWNIILPPGQLASAECLFKQ